MEKKKSFILRTNEIARFSVTDLFYDGQILISLPNRVSLTIYRLGENITLYCDLGLIGSDIDFKEICTIDILNRNYLSAVHFNPDFVTIAKSFDNSFCLEKFVRARANLNSGASASCLGRHWRDQIFIQLAQPTHKRIANLEFSILEEDRVECLGEQYMLEKPAKTLVASLQLYGQPAYYFLFIEWEGDDFWQYQKNFFFNRTSFSNILVK